jgi:hypothetical protein
MNDNVLSIDKDILLYSISANSNGFISFSHDEDLVRVGKSHYSQEEFLLKWLQNGRRAFKKQHVKRMR